MHGNTRPPPLLTKTLTRALLGALLVVANLADAQDEERPSGGQEFKAEIEFAGARLKEATASEPPVQPGAPNLGLLSQKVKALETKSFQESQTLDVSFEFGKQAAQQMSNSATILKWAQRVLLVEQDISDISNLWSDEDFRNTWDNLKDWGAVAGVAAAAIGTTVKSDSGQRATIGIGLGVAGISQLLGVILGAEKGDQIKTKTVFVEYTRRAYDDLVIRKGMLLGYTRSNAEFVGRIRVFLRDYNNARTPDEKAARLVAVEAYFLEFQRILSQMPEYLSALSAAINHYESSFQQYKGDAKISSLLGKLQKAQANIADINSEYNQDVRPILDVSVDVLKIIRGQAPNSVAPKQ